MHSSPDLPSYLKRGLDFTGSCHKRQKPQAPTPQAPIRSCQTRKVANAKVHNRYTNLTYVMIGLPIIWQLRTLAFAALALAGFWRCFWQ